MEEFLSLVAVHLAISFTLKPTFLLLWMLMMKDVAELPLQVQSFEIQKAQCYCCTVGHKHPDGGEIPCDRKLIYGVLDKWYRDRSQNPLHSEGHLEAFNRAARETLTNQVVPKMRKNALFAYLLGLLDPYDSNPYV